MFTNPQFTDSPLLGFLDVVEMHVVVESGAMRSPPPPPPASASATAASCSATSSTTSTSLWASCSPDALRGEVRRSRRCKC